MKKYLFYILAFLFLPTLGKSQFYNGSIQNFGKNRIQYKDFYWQYFKYPKFNVYYYKGGEELAQYTGKRAMDAIPFMEKFFEYTLDESLDLIVYTSHTDFKQTNLGLTANESSNIGGATRLVGNKVFFYYPGTHEELDVQIQSGIAEVMINKLLYGGSLRDMVRSSTLLTIPAWYEKGLVSYAGNPWDEHINNVVKDGILSGEFEKFNRLEGEKARQAGHAIWNYIAEVYGEKVIGSILYMTRVTRSIEAGFLYVLGVDLDMLSQGYLDFYRQKFQEDEKLRRSPTAAELDIKTREDEVYTQYKLNPQGTRAAYVSNRLGQYRIYTFDVKKEKRKKVLKKEHKLDRITDLSFPSITWHPNGNILAYVAERKGKLYLVRLDVEKGKKEKVELFGLDKVLDFDFSPDGKNMVFSGVVEGQTDLYYYYVNGNRQERLTDDIYDDVQPTFADNGNSIIYASNKPDTTGGVSSAPAENKDIFLLELGTVPRSFRRLTQTPNQDESRPHDYGDLKYTFLNNKTDVINRFYLKFDSTIVGVDTTINYKLYSSTYPLTNYNRNVLSYNVANKSGKYSMLIYENGRYRFYYGNTANDEAVSLAEIKRSSIKSIKRINLDELTETTVKEVPRDFDQTGGGAVRDTAGTSSKTDAYKVPIENEDREVDINNYQFGNEKPQPSNDVLEQKEVTEDTGKKSIVDLGPKEEFAPEQRTYFVNYAADEVYTQVDNTFNNQFYQILSSPDNINPGVSAYLKLAASDLFEDYKIVGGYRTSFGLQNSDFAVAFIDLKNRVDKTISGQRVSQTFTNDFSQSKLISHLVNYTLSYPLSEVARVSGTAIFRTDRLSALALDNFSLSRPIGNLNQVGAKVEYVFDNTLKRGTNIMYGARAKVFAEFYDGVDEKNATTQVYGFDARHYTKVHRCMILALRLSGSTSLGSRRVNYFLGGLDRWLITPRSEATALANDERLFYQALASPLRGFNKNIKNGNSFALANAEIRFPVFRYFSNKPLRSEFFESFQLVGFADAGTAWNGSSSPFEKENIYNQTVNDFGSGIIRFQDLNSPIVYGFGFGVRAKLLGYFARFDWGWGVENETIQPRVFSVSLSLDF